MGFATGHTQPASFVANGQLRDGSPFGIITTTPNAYYYDIRIRYVRSTLVAEVAEASTLAGLGSATFKAKPREFLLNIANTTATTPPPYSAAVASLAGLVATNATLLTISLTDNGLIPTATNALIGYKQDADGKILTAPLDVITTGTGTGTSTGVAPTTNTGTKPTGTDSGSGSKISNTTKILIGVAVAAVIGVVVYFVMKKGKPGKAGKK